MCKQVERMASNEKEWVTFLSEYGVHAKNVLAKLTLSDDSFYVERDFVLPDWDSS